MGKTPDEWTVGDLDAGFKNAALVLDETFVTPEHQPSVPRDPHRDGVLAERQGLRSLLARRAPLKPCRRSRDGWASSVRDKVVFISEYTGGGFGSKITGAIFD